MSSPPRRRFLEQAASGALLASAAPLSAFAQERRFEPRPGAWRNYGQVAMDPADVGDPLAPDEFKYAITAREIAA
jgi:hypothetical protein